MATQYFARPKLQWFGISTAYVVRKIGLSDLRDALRLAGSPYSVWRDIILTNSDNLDRALGQLILALDELRGDLRTRALEEEFAAAGELYKILRDLQ